MLWALSLWLWPLKCSQVSGQKEYGSNMNSCLHNGRKRGCMQQRALLDQLLQPLTANALWQWWSETPIVLRIAKNTRCVTQWLLNLLAWELSRCFSITGLLYLQPCSYKQGYPLLLVLCQLAITGTSVWGKSRQCRYPVAKCSAACPTLQTLWLMFWPAADSVPHSFLFEPFSHKRTKKAPWIPTLISHKPIKLVILKDGFKIHFISCQEYSRPKLVPTFQSKAILNVISASCDKQSYCATVNINLVQRGN